MIDALVLVNSQRRFIATEAEIEDQLRWVTPDQRVHDHCASAFRQWIEAAGVEDQICVVSAYRSLAEQTSLYHHSLQENGAAFTAAYIARPGHSEHHTGLAIDIGWIGHDTNLINPDFDAHPKAAELAALAATYGFIQRYPADKEEITRISCEPWHFRYVGCPHAQIMRDHNFCLEEYENYRQTSPLCHQPIPASRAEPLPVNTERAWVELDTSALRHNVLQLQRQLGSGQRIMAVLKANAYGHGLEPITRQLVALGVQDFAVATLAEALAVRQAGGTGELLILSGILPQQAEITSRNAISFCLADLATAQSLDALGLPLLAHVPIDTGMRRFGADALDLDAILPFYQFENIHIQGTYSHLCMSDSTENDQTAYSCAQIWRFTQCVEALRNQGIDPGKIHLQGTYGFLNYHELPCDWVRIGIALFGCVDSRRCRMPQVWKPVLSVSARIVAIKQVAAGEGIGYDHRYVTAEPAVLGVLAIGYGDGVFREYAFRQGYVLVHGQRAPIVGTICMDQCIIDLTGIDAKVYDEARVIGRQGDQEISALHIARQLNTIVPEILSVLRGRLPRILT